MEIKNVNENVDLKDKCLYDDKKDLSLIKENIVEIDEIIIDLANVKTNYFIKSIINTSC